MDTKPEASKSISGLTLMVDRTLRESASEPASPMLRSMASRTAVDRWNGANTESLMSRDGAAGLVERPAYDPLMDPSFQQFSRDHMGACASAPSSLLHAPPWDGTPGSIASNCTTNTWTDSELASCMKAGPLSDTCLFVDNASSTSPPPITHARSASEFEMSKGLEEPHFSPPRNLRGPRRPVIGTHQHHKPPPSKMFHSVMKNALAHGTVAPGQPFPARRVKDKVVPLELTQDLGANESLEDETEEECTAFCIAYELDLRPLEHHLIERFGPAAVFRYPEDNKDGSPVGAPDTLFAKFSDEYGRFCGDVIYFEFGVVVAWNLTVGQEFDAVFLMAMPHATQPLPEADVEVDEFKMHYSVNKPPHVQNDTIVLANRYCKDQLMKLSVSLALAQSTRISVQEKQVIDIVMETRDLPIELGKSGKVLMSSEKLAQAIGSVFLQKSALNLQVLTGNGETPKFFYGRDDYLSRAYKTVSEYLEMDGRIDVLNSRFQVLTDMLNLLRDQQCVSHEQHLEWIIITLIVITCALGMFQIASLLGVISIKHQGPATLGKALAYGVQCLARHIGVARHTGTSLLHGGDDDGLYH